MNTTEEEYNANMKSNKDAEEVELSDPGEDEEINLTNLPYELLEKICIRTDYETSLNLRLTCSTLKRFVDHCIGILLQLVEDPLHEDWRSRVKFIGGVRYSLGQVKNMLGEKDSDGVRRYFNREFCFDDIISYPEQLLAMQFNGKIHFEFLFDVLSKCRNLKYILVHKDVEIEGDLSPLLIKENIDTRSLERFRWLSILSHRNDMVQQFSFSKLEQITIRFGRSGDATSNFINFTLLLICLRSERMKKAQLEIIEIKDFTEIEYFHLSMIIADFIQAHNNTLKEFTLVMNPATTDPIPDSEYEEVLSNTFNKQLLLNSGDIQGGSGDSVDSKSRMIVTLRQKFESIAKNSKLSYLNITIFPNFHWDYWLVFIENLTKLVTLYILASTKYKILKNCEFLNKSSKTLKRIRMELDVESDFDFLGIEQCENLEEVFLFHRPRHLRPSSIADNIVGGSIPGVTNSKLIPGGLKTLCLGDIALYTDDLNKMLSKQKKLETLVILSKHITCSSNYYIIAGQIPIYPDCKCLKKIFRMRNLQSCLIQNFRGLTKKTYTRLLEMLDFQLNPKIRAFVEEWNNDHIDDEQYFPLLLQHASLNIVSREQYQPYTWEQQTNAYRYLLRFNKKDPYL